MRPFHAVPMLLLLFFCACGPKKSANPETAANPVITPPEVAKSDSIEMFSIAWYAQARLGFDTVFRAHAQDKTFELHEIPYELHFGALFGGKTRYAALRLNSNDSICRVLVLRENGSNWDTLLQLQQHFELSMPIFDQFLQFGDFDGDHIPDIKVLRNWTDFHTAEWSDLWLFRGEHFEKVEGFEEIPNAEYDPATHRIVAYQSAGCADMSMYFAEYALSDHKVKLVHELNCDCCIESGNQCTLQYGDAPPFKVLISRAHRYVPPYYRAAVKEKCLPD